MNGYVCRFGLKSPPLTFQRLINGIFAGMHGKTVFAYLDDTIVASKDPGTQFEISLSEIAGSWLESKAH